VSAGTPRFGRDDFDHDHDHDHDHDWSAAEQAAVDVLKAMAENDLGFAGRDDEVWSVLGAEARDRGLPSGDRQRRAGPVG